MSKLAGMVLLLIGTAGLVTAAPVIAPEIDATVAGSALALLTGAVLISRTSRKKK
jgi:hypothetical protein